MREKRDQSFEDSGDDWSCRKILLFSCSLVALRASPWAMKKQGEEKCRRQFLRENGSPTFTCAVEMISRTECRVHHRLDATVDAILSGKSPLFEIRHMDPEVKSSDDLAKISQKQQKEDTDFVKLANRSTTGTESEDDL
ncbi:uncharacterized protein LOC130590051 [Beta vulgaris subsp. vulgaris]|uniref:uncharacterized protein LOC130590051 n=1 Tax=Beta vulgaris subsp. vulgaris TaxID=3555 RepID=UPI0025496ED3|nr:uncharacterized protein LOC130590051 [Beta vulgaris subsp. vulgaris]